MRLLGGRTRADCLFHCSRTAIKLPLLPMIAQMSGRGFEFPGDYITELRDCNDLAENFDALRARMEEDGYLLIRGFADRDAVLKTRQAIVTKMDESGCFQPGTDPMDGIIGPAGARGFRIQTVPDQDIRGLFETEPFLPFFEQYFETDAKMVPKTITRIKAKGKGTGIHCDNVYVGRGSDRVLSIWIPFGDLTVEQSPLAICFGSHNQRSFQKLRDTYGKHDADRDRIKGANNAPGHFSWDLEDVTEHFAGQWKTTNFRAGDVLIFPPFTIHCGLDNTTDRYRISCDCRFQPAADPLDPRFTFASGSKADSELLRHRYQVANGEVPSVTMEEARADWGL